MAQGIWGAQLATNEMGLELDESGRNCGNCTKINKMKHLNLKYVPFQVYKVFR